MWLLFLERKNLNFYFFLFFFPVLTLFLQFRMQFQPFSDDDFVCLLDLLNSMDDKVFLVNDGDVKVWRRPDKKNKALVVMRASITVSDLDPEDVMSVWKDIEYRFHWDDRCVRNECYETVGEGELLNELGYYEAKAPPPLSNRDFVVQSGFRYCFQEKKQWLFMNKSIDHEAFPEQKGIVRGISHITGTQVLLNEDGTTTINYGKSMLCLLLK